MQSKVEIMAPAGSYESLMAAVKAGADSVYFGVEQLNMRARAANNFTLKDLHKIAGICSENKLRAYLTVNTIMYDHDMALMRNICNAAKEAAITAVIASDISTIAYAHSIGLRVHCSTQMNIGNMEAVKFYAEYADAMILARELTLSQIKHICEEIKKQNVTGPSGNLVGTEIFIHGALCVAVSGICYMSLATYNASANRGACLQNCRRAYRLIDEETGEELVVDNKYIMSPKDLCTIGFIDKIIGSGVNVLKIEGRGRPPDYVYVVTKAYREAVDSFYNGTYTQQKIETWTKELETVYNRGFWHGGYYLGKKLGEWSGAYGSKARKEKEFLGVARNYYNHAKMAEFILQAGSLKVGDEIMVTGPTTGIAQAFISSIMKDDKKIINAKKGDVITMPVPEKVRRNDKLFLLKIKNDKDSIPKG